ncbi:hypothetical protein ACFM35_01760 [Microbacterium sp. P01]|uniref:hypothetical protein n=1 Tax=Microbacterium sp. P01 TaxID=3366261 RepID=UPI00366A695D
MAAPQPGTGGVSEALDRDRPDVAVVVRGATLPVDLIDRAVSIARANEGGVHVIRLVELVGARLGGQIVSDADAGRMALARTLSRYLERHIDIPITERVHHGTLDSLTDSLEPSVGLVLLADTSEAAKHIGAL